MEPTSPYSDVGKGAPPFYGTLGGSVCFPMPLMYNPSYPFAPFLPLHHPAVLSPDTTGLMSSGHTDLHKSDDLGTRALAYLQSRYQSLNKCFLPSPRKPLKYCPTSLSQSDSGKLLSGYSDPPVESVSPDKSVYSPATELEEPDSSGKCSTDGLIEQKVTTRWSCDSSQPPICPICTINLTSQDINDHFRMEIDRLEDIIRKKEFLTQEEHNAQQNTLRLQAYHDVEKKCPEFRKETYLRVRANRINRLGGCGPRMKRQYFEESKHSWKVPRTNALCSPKQEVMSDDSSVQSGHQSMLMLELTVQQLAHRAEGRTESQSYPLPENRAANLFQPSHEGYNEDQTKSDIADSSCNGFNNLEPCSGFSESGIPRVSEDNPCSSLDLKCHVCQEQYKKPVVSVGCWHVHCENCWLKSLGNKRVCPQCDVITSPGDLRRIHL